MTASLSNTGVTAGTYSKVTIDAKGRVIAGAVLVAADIPTNTDTTKLPTAGGTMTGTLNLMKGTATTAPLKLTSGTNLISAQAGAVEFDGTSIYFTNNLSARQLAATELPPKTVSGEGALYGLPKLKRILNNLNDNLNDNLNNKLNTIETQPIFVPNFKNDKIAVIIDEENLTAQGILEVRNIWQEAREVRATVMVNGQNAGSTYDTSLTMGNAISIPWTYTFSSLDESSNIDMTVNISYLDQTAFTFDEVGNPILGFIGAFNFSNLTKVLFIQSQYDLIAFKQTQGTSEIKSFSIPIERDSTFPGEQFNQMFTPVVRC